MMRISWDNNAAAVESAHDTHDAMRCLRSARSVEELSDADLRMERDEILHSCGDQYFLSLVRQEVDSITSKVHLLTLEADAVLALLRSDTTDTPTMRTTDTPTACAADPPTTQSLTPPTCFS